MEDGLSPIRFRAENEALYLCHLIGPLVTELVRDGSGALDTARVRAKNFDEFRAFLLDHASINDGIFFSPIRSNYSKVLGRKKYTPLLELLYTGNLETEFPIEVIRRYKTLINEFTADLIEVDAEDFARRYMPTEFGRAFLEESVRRFRAQGADVFLTARAGLSRGVAHASKGIAKKADRKRVTDAVTWFDYYLERPFGGERFPLNKREVSIAEASALTLIDRVDAYEVGIDSRRQDYGTEVFLNGKNLFSIPLLGKTLPPWLNEKKQTDVVAQNVKRIVAIRDKTMTDLSVKGQFRLKLANVWLWAADSENWKAVKKSSDERDAVRRHILNRTDALISLLEGVRNEKDFEWFIELVQHTFCDALDVNGPSFSNWLADKIVGRGILDYCSDMSLPVKRPLDDLVRTTAEFESSIDLGLSSLNSRANSVKAGDDLKNHAENIIFALESVRRSVCHGYKQHGALSRGISRAAHIFGAGDLRDIEDAGKAIDRIISRIANISTKEEMLAVLDMIFSELGPGGAIRSALISAENDGIEASLGSLQLVLEIAIPALIPGGQAYAATKLKALAGVMKSTGVSARVANTTARMAGGFAMGAYLATADNTVAVVTGEARDPRRDNALVWMKDAVATGTAMSLTGLMPERMVFGNSVFRNLFDRYSIDRVSAVSNFVKDTTAAVGISAVENQTRMALDGRFELPRRRELVNTALVSTVGGALKVDIARQMSRTRGPVVLGPRTMTVKDK